MKDEIGLNSLDNEESMEIVRKMVEKIDISKLSNNSKELKNRLERVEKKLDMLNKKLDKVIEDEIETKTLKDIHMKIINMLTGGWMGTEDLANALGKRQAYISREVNKLRKMDLVKKERRGKKIFYTASGDKA